MKASILGAFCLLILSAIASAEGREMASKLAKQMRTGIASFRLDLTYYGPADKAKAQPYNLTLSVPPVEQLAKDPQRLIVQIKEAQAEKIISWLEERDGFFDRSIDDMSQDITLRAPKGPTYWLTVSYSVPTFGRMSRHEDLGWNAQMLKRLDSLKAELDKEPAGAIDQLLERLTDERRLWKAE
jgi:hypothetical protein